MNRELRNDVQAPSGRQLGNVVAISAIILVAINLRPALVSVGPILPSIIDEFGLSHAAASLLISIPDVLMGILALPTPWLARRFGRDPVLLSALLILSVSTAARAFSTNTLQLLVSTAGVGVGIAIAGALVAGFIKARFPTRAALMMGIYATSLSLGSTVSAAITGPVATSSAGGWRLASGMWTVLGISAISSWIVVHILEKRERVAVPLSAAPAPIPVRNPTAWLVAGYFAFINFLFYALLSWVSPMYREAGLSATVAGLLLASFTFVFMCASPVLGWLSKSEDRRQWLALSAGLALVGLTMIAAVPTLFPFIAISLCAFGLGGAFTLGMTLPLDNTSSVAEANAWNAFVLTVGYLVAATGPLIVGHLRDIAGNFQPSFWLLAGVALAMLAVTPFLRPQKIREVK